MVPLIQKRQVAHIQKPAPRPPVAVVGPSTVAAPFAQNAPVAKPAQSDLAAPDAPDDIA